MTRLALLSLLAIGCAAPKHATGLLVLRVSPPDARVSLDDRVIGRARDLAGHSLRINTGHRRIEVTADGHYAQRREADISSTKSAELQIDLHPVPSGEPEQ